MSINIIFTPTVQISPHSVCYNTPIKDIRRCIMDQIVFSKDTWRLLIIDKSGLYSQIYDEIYGNNPETLRELKEIYSNDERFECIVL